MQNAQRNLSWQSIREPNALPQGSPFVRAQDRAAATRLTLLRLVRRPDGYATRSGSRGVQVLLGRAWQRLLEMRLDGLSSMIRTLEAQLANLPIDFAEQTRDEIRLIQAVSLIFVDDSQSALAIANTVLTRSSHRCARDVAGVVCRFGHWSEGAIDSFYRIHPLPLREGNARAQLILAVFDTVIEAKAELDQLRPANAIALAEAALDVAESAAGRSSMPASLAASIIGQILYEQGKLQEARECLTGRIGAIRKSGSIDCAVRAYPVLVRIACHDRQFELAKLLLDDAEHLAQTRGWPRLMATALSERVRLMLQSSDVAGARECVDRMKRLVARHCDESRPARFDLERYAVLSCCRIELAEAPSDRTVAAIRQLHYDAVCRGELFLAFQLVVMLVEGLIAIDQTAEADAVLLEAVQLAAPLGLRQMFVDTAPLVLERLEDILTDPRHGNLDETSSFRLALQRVNSERPITDKVIRSTFRSNGALSQRENNVLVLLGRGLSNKRIAQELEIAPETVKSHAKAIFGKLAVKSRSEAVTRALQFGLI